MVYRHIYWGLLNIGPSEDNELTEAVKPKAYLVKITTKRAYKTKEEAMEDDMSYAFHVWRDDITLAGSSAKIKERILNGQGNYGDLFEGYDYIGQEDWPRYRMIRLRDGADITPAGIKEEICRAGRPTGKRWEKIFPVRGEYPLKKIAYSIIALPDVNDEGENNADTGKQGP